MHRTVTLRYSDGVEKIMQVADGQTVLDAAEASGIPIVSDCQAGVCGTCVGTCSSGQYEIGRVDGLSDLDRENRKLLTCQATVQSDCTIELSYPAANNAASILVGEGIVTSVELHSATTALLRIDTSSLSDQLDFKAGQYAQLQVPGSEMWRSYSYANAPGQGAELEFIVRLLPDGAMSNYLREQAKPGDAIAMRCSKGGFHLRQIKRPTVLIAGGTGLSAILSMAKSLQNETLEHPVTVLYGVTQHQELCKLDELRALEAAQPQFKFSCIVANQDLAWQGATGLVTDLLNPALLNDGDADVYLCGPAAMVQATRQWLEDANLHKVSVFFEKFVPSGQSLSARRNQRLDVSSLDFPSIRQQGRGTAVVIGGSIGGIASAKVLSEKFDKVIVLEQDGQHHRTESRPGASQGAHLHHILTAGQQELERLFPGIVDDMVAEGAFKVDMAEQYQLRLAGAWKKQCKSGIEIVCAGRPLLEWCIRRRLDAIPNIEFHYDSEVQDLVYDADRNAVLGVAVDRAQGLSVVPAEFVIDASGKSTRLPEFMERMGLGAPAIEEDMINCFYSTLYHKVPEDRRWKDKVMVICYAYRPNEETYSAQYYRDSSRSILSTTLVAYNMYNPPRNPQEFREYARLMPSPQVGEIIDGLEPASQVFNFRHPRMQRFYYEKMRKLPTGIVAIGDAYTSTDPIAGLGMTITVQGVARLRENLSKRSPTHASFAKKFYCDLGKIADGAWFVIREQNLRFPWLKDVEQKRPFYFPVLTWYMDRLLELVHEDMDAYRRFLSVIHMVNSPAAILSPPMIVRVVGHWLKIKLRGGKSLIEQNYEPVARSAVEGSAADASSGVSR